MKNATIPLSGSKRIHPRAAVLSCSPRPGGNSDTAVRLFAKGYASLASAGSLPIVLREHAVLPCTGCGACRRAIGLLPSEATLLNLPGFGCPLTAKDQSAPLLKLLAEAAALCLVSPIYFYHLPAQLKALLDRTQPFWNLDDMDIDCFRGRERSCHVILIGARQRGKRLFEGSLLTLKYALAPLGIRLEKPLLLYGLDSPFALAGDSRAQKQVFQYGRQAAGLC